LKQRIFEDFYQVEITFFRRFWKKTDIADVIVMASMAEIQIEDAFLKVCSMVDATM
jgi:hypothetical protein